MNQRIGGSLVVVALMLLAADIASAQRPQTREGFWIAFGLGYGSAGLSCDGCDTGREGSGTAHVRLGGTLNERLLLGGDITGWAKEQGGATATIGNISFVAQYYPMPAGGLFLKGGAGFSFTSLESSGITADGGSFGVSAGAGYDIRVGSNLSITPIVDFLYGGSRDLQASGSPVATGVSSTVISVGLGVTFH